MLSRRTILISNDEVAIVKQDAELGDAEHFVESRKDKNVLNQIGAHGNEYFVDIVKRDMINIHSERSIYTIAAVNNGRYLGDVRIIKNKDDCELGIVILEQERNKGYGSKVILLASQYAFDELKVKKVYLKVNHNNPRAKNLYENLGFQYEKTISKGYVIDGIQILTDCYVLKKDDFKTLLL